MDGFGGFHPHGLRPFSGITSHRSGPTGPTRSCFAVIRSHVGQNARVALQKITAPGTLEMTGFVVTDLAGAARATGVVRCAKKVLQDGAKTMARSQTYAWAVLGEQISGASAGISVDPAARRDGISAFVEAVLPRVQAGELSIDAAKGIGVAELSALAVADVRSPVRNETRDSGTLAEELLAAGAFAAAASALGDLDGRTLVIEGATSALPALLAAAAVHGVRVVAIATTTGTVVDATGFDLPAASAAWAEHSDAMVGALGSELPAAAVFDTEADILMCGSKLGIVGHEVATSMAQRLVVPIAPSPVTAKGLAVAGRRDITVLADFVTTSGPLFADHPAATATPQELVAAAISSIGSTVSGLGDHAEGPYLGACYRAEEFLATWQDTMPFGRPLA